MQKQPRPGEYTLAELVIAANKRITKEKIRPTDPRAKATVTARTVQFYLSKGLLPAPTRRGAQLRFDEHHVEAIVEVKRRQAEGLMLDEIVESQDLLDDSRIEVSNSWPKLTALNIEPTFLAARHMSKMRVSRTSFDRFQDFIANAAPQFRWHIPLGAGTEISGFGEPPPADVVEQIRMALALAKSDQLEETEEEK